MNKNQVLETFNSNGIELLDAIENGNNKVTDKIGKKFELIFKTFLKDKKLAKECIPPLLQNENVAIRNWIAGFALGLELYISEAEEVLYNISISEYGINSLVAEYTLKQWKEQGQLYEHLKK